MRGEFFHKHKDFILSALIFSCSIFGIGVYMESQAQNVLSDESLLREYLLPISAIVSAGDPITGDPIDGRSCQAGEGEVCVPQLNSADDVITYTLQVPESGLYKINVRLDQSLSEVEGGVPNDAFYNLSDSEVESVWNAWQASDENIPDEYPELFDGRWGAAQRNSFVRNIILGVYRPNAEGEFALTDTIEIADRNTQSVESFSALSLGAGTNTLQFRLLNDISLEYGAYSPGLHGDVSDDTFFDKNAYIDSLDIIPAARTNDVVGVRVYANSDHLSPRTWYEEKVSSLSDGVTDIQVDGYPAVREGRTVYVNAANVPDFGSSEETADKRLYTNMYVIAYNINASPQTEQIFNQMLENWRFNKNIGDETIKDMLRRDVKRLSDIGMLNRALEQYYQRNGRYPELGSGTFVPGHSLSVWPSWQQRLGAELGISMPIDPINILTQTTQANDCQSAAPGVDCTTVCSVDANGNALTGCAANEQCLAEYCSVVSAGFDPQTGWNDDQQTIWNTATFSDACPAGLVGALRLGTPDCGAEGPAYDAFPFLYQYTAVDNGARYLVTYRLEYQEEGTCRANECYYDGQCYTTSACLVDFPNTICSFGRWVNSCGDGFLQSCPDNGETAWEELCDPGLSDPSKPFCDDKFGAQDWYNEQNVSSSCTLDCTPVAEGQLPVAYSPDPTALSCGGYCGDQITQFEYGEECDIGARAGAIRRPSQGGSGGTGPDSQYYCTGPSGALTAEELAALNNNSSFEDISVQTGVNGQAGGLDGRIWNGASFTQNGVRNTSRNEWIFSQYVHSPIDQIGGIADTNVLEKNWVPYQDLFGAEAVFNDTERSEYLNGSANPSVAGYSFAQYSAIIELAEAEDGHSSAQVVRITDTGPKATVLWKMIEGISGGTTYSVSAQIKRDSEHTWPIFQNSKQLYVQMLYFDDDYDLLGSTSAQGPDGKLGFAPNNLEEDVWRTVRISQIAPEGATSAAIVIRTDHVLAGGAFFVDDVVITTANQCESIGGWCGDGIVQYGYDEQCDPAVYDTPSPAETRNILNNPGFERTFSPWQKEDAAEIRIVGTERLSGRTAAELEYTRPSDAALPQTRLLQQATLFENGGYGFEIYVRDTADVVAGVLGLYRDAADVENYIEIPLGGENVGSGWDRWSAEAAVTATADVAGFVFKYSDELSSEESAIVLVDQAAIVPVDTVPNAVFLPKQYQCGGDTLTQACQLSGGYCGDGAVDRGFGEVCDDRVGLSCASDADCGTNGSCQAGQCVSDQCDTYCRGTFCGDGIVSQPNSQGINEICDPLTDPYCLYNCQKKIIGGMCTPGADECASGLSCTVREFGDVDTRCLGGQGAIGCATDAQCIAGYYCDPYTTRCELEISTYTQFHGAQPGTLIDAIRGDGTPVSYPITSIACPKFTTVQAEGRIYQLDECTGIYWAGEDNVSQTGWTYDEAIGENGCPGAISRIPSIQELYSLVQQSDVEGLFFTNKEALNLCCVSCQYDENEDDLCAESVSDDNYLYWSSTCSQQDGNGDCTEALAVNFKYGSLESVPTDEALKIHCLSDTQCGNGVVEEGEQCEFYTQFRYTEDTCTTAADCGGGVCIDNPGTEEEVTVCATVERVEQPIQAQCSDINPQYGAGFLHCDPVSCTFTEDSCLVPSQVNRTCQEVCADLGSSCQSVGTDVTRDDESEGAVGDNGRMFDANESGVCTEVLPSLAQGAENACDYRFIDQGASCVLNTATGETSPYAVQYSYCNCE